MGFIGAFSRDLFIDALCSPMRAAYASQCRSTTRPRSEQLAVLEEFLAALRSGRLQELMDVLAPDVVFIADGGGFASAAPAPIYGAEVVARLLSRPNRVVSTVWLNGAPAVRVESDRQMAVVSLLVEVGRISRIFAMANPSKLTHLNEPVELAR